MIPKNIEKSHILKAIKEVNNSEIPKGRKSRKFFLEYDGRAYPPKYIISRANIFANREELNPETFGGGFESNDFLIGLGFIIKPIDPVAIKQVKKPHRIIQQPLKGRHNERCPKCKKTIQKLLERIYGQVHVNHKIAVRTLPEQFSRSRHYYSLKRIFEALQKHRGFKEFVRARTLPNCDFFVPNPGFILEFDESQHFTIPRKKTLEKYPENISLGFDKEKWSSICHGIMAKDNNPPYRDEQRAWYDTLRDFLPENEGLEPTKRLYSKDFVWCSLNPDNPADIEKFKDILKGGTRDWDINVSEDSNPTFARVIIARQWDGDLDEAKNILKQICVKWPKGKKVKFILTCGGFMQFDWPKSISQSDIGNNKSPNTSAVNKLIKEAENYANKLLDNTLTEKLSMVADYITLGLDSDNGQLQVELVCLFDLTKRRFYWTGKSYPTNSQERKLVRISDLKTHFFDLNGLETVMVLGCHDLNMFNNRNWNNTGEWRKNIKKDFRELTKRNKPVMVLHHPHTTVKKRTWSAPLSNMRNIIPSTSKYASAGRYHGADQKKSDYDDLNDVLQKTKNTDTIDFICGRLSH